MRVAGSLLSGVVAYVGQSWRVIWWYGALLNAFIIPIWLYLSESPRWLLAKGKYNEAKKSISYAANLNNAIVPEHVMNEIIEEAKKKNQMQSQRRRLGANIRFYRSGTIWKNLWLIYLAWFATLMVHFGLLRRSVRQDTGDIYVNFFLMDSTELIAIVISLLTINRLGRRTLLVLSCGIGGGFIVVGQITSTLGYKIATVWLLFVAKTCASISNQVFTVYVAELFPTDIRNTALGSGNTFGRLGALCGSLLVNSPLLAHYDLAILGLSYLVATVAVFILLPETNGCSMPETMDDVRVIEKSAFYTRCVKIKEPGSHTEEKEALL